MASISSGIEIPTILWVLVAYVVLILILATTFYVAGAVWVYRSLRKDVGMSVSLVFALAWGVIALYVVSRKTR